MKKKFGLILLDECKCGNYQPISITGVIISKCKNCGGEKPKYKYGNFKDKKK
jgi:hypothetical protein